MNAIVYPAGAEGVLHYHDEQDELYFVHSGTTHSTWTARCASCGPGGLAHVEATTPGSSGMAARDDLVLLIIGGKGGYVGRDGQLVNPADLAKRQAMSSGEFSAST